jgi:hypothetical protein
MALTEAALQKSELIIRHVARSRLFLARKVLIVGSNVVQSLTSDCLATSMWGLSLSTFPTREPTGEISGDKLNYSHLEPIEEKVLSKDGRSFLG